MRVGARDRRLVDLHEQRRKENEMRYVIYGQPWPLVGGAYCVPIGTTIDTVAQPDQWSKLAASQPFPPINAWPLDLAAYNAMITAGYPANNIPNKPNS